MKNPAEEMKARSSMSSTFGSMMNPDMKDFKLSMDQVLKQRKRNTYAGSDDDSDGAEVVSVGAIYMNVIDVNSVVFLLMQEITEEMIFRCSMTSDYSKIETLPIMG